MPSLGTTYRERLRHPSISIAGDRQRQAHFPRLGKVCFLERPCIVHLAASILRQSQWNFPQTDSFDPPKQSMILGIPGLMNLLHQRSKEIIVFA
jgi:hypothetical protein